MSHMLIHRNSTVKLNMYVKLEVNFFVMSVMEFKTKILTAFVNKIKVSFMLTIKYHVSNICTNFKQRLLKRSM